ncbi:MAG: hypothetical protein MJE66_08690 [Proteobacteria bacterium]|nr:hypothetical protein [Pseudomonadota bacterium]
MSRRNAVKSDVSWSARRGWTALAALALGLACAGPTGPAPGNRSPANTAGAPPWVHGGCGVYPEAEAVGRLCGVGSTEPGAPPALARETANARARGELSLRLQERTVAALARTPATSAWVEDGRDVQVARRLADLAQAATRQVDTWIGPDDSVFTLVVLERPDFRAAVARLSELPPAARRAILRETAALFVGNASP